MIQFKPLANRTGHDVPQRGHQNHLLALKSQAGFPPVAPTLAKYWMTFLVFLVLLAPVSPLGIRDILKLLAVLCTEQWHYL